MSRAETFRIESEGPPEGLVMVIGTDDGDTIRVSIQGIALEVEAEVRRELRSWALEAERARAAVARGASLSEYLTGTPDKQAGYDTGDPKHPLYHALVTELHDNRKGK